VTRRPRARAGRRLAWTGGIALLLLAAIAANSLRGRLGWSAAQLTPAELAAELEPGLVWTVPEGAGPHPAAVLLSGCDGTKPNLAVLAEALAGAGWLSVVVDSHGPRGLDRRQAWRLVCAGQLLNGAERAADIAVALHMLRARDDVDAGRLALIGQSHGGWAALDFLALARRGAPPPLLTDWPGGSAGAAGSPHAGVRAAIFYYPYCGVAAVGGSADLPRDIAYLFQLVRNDRIADETECLEVAAHLQEAGAQVDVTVFEGVTHGFDRRVKSFLSPLEFDAAATARATALTLDFLAPR
jgi:dienelactone hydrolase